MSGANWPYACPLVLTDKVLYLSEAGRFGDLGWHGGEISRPVGPPVFVVVIIIIAAHPVIPFEFGARRLPFVARPSARQAAPTEGRPEEMLTAVYPADRYWYQRRPAMQCRF